MSKPKPAPQAAVTEPVTPVEQAAEASAPINFSDPVGVADLTAGVGDTPDAAVAANADAELAKLLDKNQEVQAKEAPDPAALGITDAELGALQAEANRDNTKYDFFRKVHKARNPTPEKPPEAAPVAPRILEQTNAELDAGRALVAKNEKLRQLRSPQVPEKWDGKNTPVFRPGDYVPDQKKGQGYVGGGSPRTV